MKRLTPAQIVVIAFAIAFAAVSCARAAKVDVRPAKAAVDERRFQEAVDLLLACEKSDPRNNDVYRLLGDAYLGLSDSAKAQEAYGRAVDLKPGDREALLKWADVVMARGQAPEAIKALQKVLKSAKKDPEKAIFNDAIGRALLASSKCTEAQEYLLKATIQDDKNVGYHLDLGQAYFDCQVFSLARLEYEKVLAVDPHYCRAWYRIGVSQFRDRAFNDALVSYGKAYLCDSAYIPVYYDLALLYVLSARSVSGEKATTYYQNALYYFERYRKAWPDSNRVLVAKNVSLAYYYLRDYEKAAEELARAVDVGVQDPEMLFLLGRSLQLLQRYEEAIARFNEYESKLTEADTANVELYSRRANSRYGLAMADSSLVGDEQLLSAAVADYMKAIATDSTDERTISTLASLLDKLGKNEESIPYFDRMTQLHPTEARYWFNAALPRLKLKRELEALTFLSKAMETDTTAEGKVRDQARQFASPILLKSGRYDEARVYYQKLIAQEPNNCDHLQWYAFTYQIAQQYEQAVPHLERAYECMKRSGKKPCQMTDIIKWLATAYIQIPKPAWDKAQPLIEQGLKCDPNDADFKELQKALKGSQEMQYTPGTKAGQH